MYKKIIAFALAAILTAAGLFCLVRFAVTRRAATETANAKVVELAAEETLVSETDAATDVEYERLETVYYPVFSYEVGGQLYETKYASGNSEPAYEIGQTVEIRYNPDDPTSIVVSGDNSGLVIGGVVTLAGLAAMALAVFGKRK